MGDTTYGDYGEAVTVPKKAVNDDAAALRTALAAAERSTTTYKAECVRLTEALAAAERNLSDRTREWEEDRRTINALLVERDSANAEVERLRGVLQPLIPNQHGEYGGPLVAGKWWFEDGSEQVISSGRGIKAANALAPAPPQAKEPQQ